MALNFNNPASLMAFNNLLSTGGMGQPMNMAQAAAVIEAQKESKRQDQVQKVLPALLSQIDTADVNGSLAKLIQAGVDQKNAVALIELKLKGEQEKRLQGQAGMQEGILRVIQGQLGGGQPQAGAGEPLSVRNNNPGNMKDPRTGGFMAFDNAQMGQQAMRDDLTAKVGGRSAAMKGKFGEGYSPTLRNVISTWAPPNENNTDAYVNFVATRAGMDPDQVLTPADVDRIMPHMIRMEGGQKAADHFGQQPQAQPQKTDASALAKSGAMMAAAGLDGGNTLMQYANFEQQQQNRAEDKASDKSKAQFGQERELYNDFSKKTEDYAKVRDAVQNMQTAAADDSGAGDIQMIFAFMKAQDPGSTVREGEFATAQNSAGIPDRIRTLYNKALNGERLTPEQRRNFLRLGEANFAKAKKQHDKTKAGFEKRAKAYGLDPSRVTFDLDLEANPQPQQPAAGGWSIRRVR